MLLCLELKQKNGVKKNPNKKGNVRNYATTIELAILSNLEYHNSLLIANNISQQERLIILNNEANRQKKLFNENNLKSITRLKNE